MIMVKLLGQQQGYKLLCFRIESLWKPLGRYAIIDLDNGYCLIKFITEEDVQRALFGVPWVVMGHYLTVESWNPSFNPASHLPSKIVAWVRFLSLPIHYYNRLILFAIGSKLGKVIRLDLSKSLIASYFIHKVHLHIEYENLPDVCYACGKVGHTNVRYPSQVSGNGDLGNGNEHINQEFRMAMDGGRQPKQVDALGLWLHALKRKPRPPHQPKKKGDR
ncbi:hypothetical protein P3X46_009159 [Hevea brasiliensis]|uniref:DUF4283 domain-containing protein n=1 Tax=Hevea brasiliensis TaxID=3981 RepID=A0ABQ9ML40_HEVBR|nr:hypothetical protein P3X46_009159 [Hevea brasiliensis]